MRIKHLTPAPTPNPLDDMNSLLHRCSAGDDQALQRIKRELRSSLYQQVEHRFADVPPSERAGVKRLYFQLLQQYNVTQTLRNLGPDWELVQAVLFMELSIQVLARYQAPQRDEERRLKQLMTERFGFGSEDALILQLDLQRSISALKREHPRIFHCWYMKTIMAFTLKTIMEQTGYSMQEVRTRLKKAENFLKSRLKHP